MKSAQTSHFCYCYFPVIHQIQGLFIRARLTVLARLPGWILPWVHMRNFSPVSEIRKGQRSWERVPAPNSGNKANMPKHKILTFGPILPSVTLTAVSLQLNGMLMMWKIQQAMQDDAIRTARIHPAVHPGNRDDVFIWQNFQPAYRDLGNRASPPSHRNTSKLYKGFRGEVRSRKPGPTWSTGLIWRGPQ